MLKGFTRKFKPLDLLAEEELEAIHRGALYVLEKTGMRVEHDRALKVYAGHGCIVDFEERRVRIPPGLVEECLRKCPSSYILKARNPDQDLMVGGNTVYFMQGMGMRYVNLETWETRPATTAEHREAMIIGDALDNVHLADGVFFYMERQGIPPVMVMLENLASGLRYSSKAEQFGYQKDCEIFAIKMAQALGINLDPELDTASPLTMYGGAVEAALRYVEAGIPIQPCSSMTMGAEGPVTLAGAMVLGVAIVMAWAVLTQLVKPGAPMSIQHGLKPMDMQRGSPRFGSPEYALTGTMMNQMLRKYSIPSCPGSGFTSTSKTIDYQVGYQKSLGALLSAMSGGHLLIFQGGSCSELLYHPVLSILDDDVAGWIGHFLEGATVTDETLAIDLINQVGPIPGHYLGTEHTRKWWRQQQYMPKVAELEAYPIWVRSGKKDALALARERAEHILATHQPQPLIPAQEQAIEDILKEARDYYREKGLISAEEWATYMKTLGSGSEPGIN
jgi:trimethylamine--corrinoid protein Co-methyltransferase